MNKKVSFGVKPTSKPEVATSVDAWVEDRSAPDEMKRLTIDIPASLHTRIKTTCAQRGVKMADEIRALLHKHFEAS